MRPEILPMLDAPRIDIADRNLLVELHESLMPEYAPVFALHTVFGKENSSASHDFTNIPFNQGLKGLVGIVLTDMLGFSSGEQHEFINAVIAPNSDLYMRIHPEEFTDDDRYKFDSYRSSLFLNERLIDAAGPKFFTSGRWKEKNVTIAESLMPVVTDLVEERREHKLALVNPEAHILEWMVESRAKLGREYWMNELKHDYETMMKLFPSIRIEDFPFVIYDELIKRIRS